jgi:hypothetical protein
MGGIVMATKFEEKLAFGKIAEKEVEALYMDCGFSVIRSYDYNGEDNKSPRMFAKNKNYVLPDLDVSRAGVRKWLECKHYSQTPMNRRLGIHVHGIKKRLYNDYLNVQRETGTPVFLVIKEIEGDCLLYARLDSLKTYPCQCHHECTEQCLIYFNRADFQILTKEAV